MRQTHPTVGTEVYLNVYDLTDYNSYLYSNTVYPPLTVDIGFGFYHSGVEVNGVEYSFGEGCGVCEGVPKDVIGARFRESIHLGETNKTNEEITKAVDSLRPRYRGEDYNMILKNCNNFSNDLCKALLGIEIPGYVNRCAYIASFFSCCIPSTRDDDDEPLPASRFQGKGNRLGSTDQRGVDAEYQRAMRLKAMKRSRVC